LYLDRTTFSDELPQCGINKTVANVGIQILAYLGFTEIYLLGVDMTYTVPKGAILENARDITATEDDDESHFDPRYFGKGRKFHVPMLDETFAKFREAREHYEPRGVTIVNATVGGALEEFRRVPLNDVLGYSFNEKQTIFRELVESKLRTPNVDVLEAAASAPLIDAPHQVDASWSMFRTSAAAANKVILRWVFDFIPFGPIQGTHLFVNRRLMHG
jgi:hypothetical protein